MRKKIALLGSSGASSEKAVAAAKEIGKAIAEKNCILITGATTGLPFEAAKAAKEKNGFVIGISPALDADEHKQLGLPLEPHDAIIFTGFGFKGRNVIVVRSTDAAIIVSGSIGTLNEFTIGFDETTIIGILEGSGGIADKLREIIAVCEKKGRAKIIFEKDPLLLVEKVLRELK